MDVADGNDAGAVYAHAVLPDVLLQLTHAGRTLRHSHATEDKKKKRKIFFFRFFFFRLLFLEHHAYLRPVMCRVLLRSCCNLIPLYADGLVL